MALVCERERLLNRAASISRHLEDAYNLRFGPHLRLGADKSGAIGLVPGELGCLFGSTSGYLEDLLDPISSWPGAVLITGLEPEQAGRLLKERSARLPHTDGALIGYSSVRSSLSINWTPLSGCQHHSVAKHRARVVLDMLAHQGHIPGAPELRSSALSVLAPMLEAASNLGGSLSQLAGWVFSEGSPDWPALLDPATVRPALHAELEAAFAQLLEERKEAGNEASPLDRVISIWLAVFNQVGAQPLPAAGGRQFDRFLIEGGTLLMTNTNNPQATTALACMVDQLLSRTLELSASGHLIYPALVLILEPAESASCPHLPEYLTRLVKQGQLVLWQTETIDSLVGIWGQHRSSATWEQSHAKVFRGGEVGHQALEVASTLPGVHLAKLRSLQKGSLMLCQAGSSQVLESAAA